MKTAMKSAKRMLALALLVICVISALVIPACAEPSTGDLIRFMPSTITVKDDEVEVEGYFVNLNEHVIICKFTDLDMVIWEKGDELLRGSFGDIDVSVRPQSNTYWCFVFDNDAGYENGVYECDETIYATFGAGFTMVKA